MNDWFKFLYFVWSLCFFGYLWTDNIECFLIAVITTCILGIGAMVSYMLQD